MSVARALAIAVSATMPVLLSGCSSSSPSGCAACDAGQICAENSHGEAVCADAVMCGGFAGLACPQGYVDCVDNPLDQCDPAQGDMDCTGLCVPPPMSPW